MIAGALRRNLAFSVVLVISAVWSAFVILPHVSGREGISDALEYRLLDLRHRLVGPVAPMDDVAIVTFDDRALAAQVFSDRSTRQQLAMVISRIAEAGAAGLALDVLLADAGNPQEDKALAAALGQMPSAIAMAARFEDGESTAVRLIRPQEVFLGSARSGLVNFSADAGGTPRFLPLLVEADGQLVPSLPLLAVLSVSGEKAAFAPDGVSLGDRVMRLDHGFDMALRYLGPAGTIPTLSASDLIEAPGDDLLAGKVVVLGFSAAATGDRFATPFDDDMPGMEIIATAISQLKGGPSLARGAALRRIDAVHAALLVGLSAGLLLILPLAQGATATIFLFALSFAGATLAFAAGHWLSAALPLVAAGPAAVVAAGLRYQLERGTAARSARTARSLMRFQTPALARRIEEDPDYLAAPQEQDLVVFFVDLTGFTGLSQRLGPEGTRHLLQAFHGRVAACVEGQGGSVFNYMGDGVMAVYGLASEPAADSCRAALRSAFDLVAALDAETFDGVPAGTLRCRIGLHLGPVTLSRLGADSHQQVTVTGDTVNLASRLMEVAKEISATIVASESVAHLSAPQGDWPNGESNDVSIRGRRGMVPTVSWTLDRVLAHYG